MSVMCCPLSSGSGYGPACWTEKMRTARKEHRCVECREAINAGAKYEYVSGVWDGDPHSYKTCAICKEIRDHFACEGYIFGQVWSDLEDNFFPDMKAGGPCMEGLSPAAKLCLFERRTAWLLAQDD